MSSLLRVSVAQTSSALPELGVVGRQVEAADDAATRELGQHGRHGAIELQHRLVEARAIERELHALDARERGDELVGARGAIRWQRAQDLPALTS